MPEPRRFYDEASQCVLCDRSLRGAVFTSTIVEFMRNKLASQSKEAVMNTLGISANTWVKIKKGQPIRQSTAEKLMRRLRRDYR